MAKKPPHRPHDRAWHYAEADRLLAKAAEVTKEYVETEVTLHVRKEDLGGLAHLLSERAYAHAVLAQTAERVVNDAFEVLSTPAGAADRASGPDVGPEVTAQVLNSDGPDWAAVRADLLR